MKRRVLSLFLTLALLISSASALTVEQAGEILERYYIDDIPSQVLEQATVEEMLALLGDPYTDYYTARQYADFLASMEDSELVGIGIRAYYLEEGILLTQVAPDSPAQEGGLKPGDCIVAVDGHDTRGAGEGDIDTWIHGEEGTQVTLTVLRGEEQFDLTLPRRAVVFPTVTLEKIENRIGWIRCEAFGSNTFRRFYEIITTHDDEVDEWVIDLRENGGGDVLSALFCAGCFTGSGEGVYMRDGQGEYLVYLFNPGLITAAKHFDGELTGFDITGRLTDDPAHVLVGPGTASAAEMFAAMIRDSGAGLVVGERTYGKGVAQTLINAGNEEVGAYFPEGDALKLTTERVYASAGGTFHRVGVLPHIAVEADLADEVAAILFGAVDGEKDWVSFRGLSSDRDGIRNVTVQTEVLRDPANSQAVRQILSALPAASYCVRDEGSGIYGISVKKLADLCGVEPQRNVFSDVEESNYADAINTMAVSGILHGDGTGTFDPQTELTRAALCAMIAKALRLPAVQGAASFADVKEDAWYAPFVNAMAAAGFMDADESGLFRPEEPVSCQDLILTLGRMTKWLNMDHYELLRHEGRYGDHLPGPEELAQQYPAFTEEVRDLVWLFDRKLAWDALASADPASVITREEAAAGLYNLLSKSGVVPT